MKTSIRFASAIITMFILGVIAPHSAKADVSMLVTIDEGQWSLQVPEADTTVSAYGGDLRLYDVHIAKMVEVTHDSCSRERMEDSSQAGNYHRNYDWNYTADQGREDMGLFTISCGLAQELVNTYGLGEPAPTAIRFEIRSAEMGIRTDMIPMLNVTTDEKVEEWIRFTNNFTPGYVAPR
jgi:hypothetical protein